MANALKEQLLKDIEIMRTMDTPVMEASLYYKAIINKLKTVVLIFLLSEFVISLAYSLMGNSALGKLEGLEYITVPLQETMMFGGGFLCVFGFFTLPQNLSKLVLFEYYYQDKLQSGPFIAKKIRQFLILIYNFFFMVSFITGAYFGLFFIGNFIAFFAGLFIIPKIVALEFDRLAIPSIAAFFSKPNEEIR
jgi:hypothetical protein